MEGICLMIVSMKRTQFRAYEPKPGGSPPTCALSMRKRCVGCGLAVWTFVPLCLLTYHGLPSSLRRVLHRALDLLADSGDAAWQAGWDPVCPASAGLGVRVVWEAGATRSVRQSAAHARDVRQLSGGGDGEALLYGARHASRQSSAPLEQRACRTGACVGRFG